MSLFVLAAQKVIIIVLFRQELSFDWHTYCGRSCRVQGYCNITARMVTPWLLGKNVTFLWVQDDWRNILFCHLICYAQLESKRNLLLATVASRSCIWVVRRWLYRRYTYRSTWFPSLWGYFRTRHLLREKVDCHSGDNTVHFRRRPSGFVMV